MRILLANADEDYRFACRVHHVDRSAHLFIHGVKLGQYNSVDRPWIGFVHGEVDQRLIEFGQLVD